MKRKIAAALLSIFVIGAMTMPAFAQVKEDLPAEQVLDVLNAEDSMNSSNGTININYGTINELKRQATLKENRGKIGANFSVVALMPAIGSQEPGFLVNYGEVDNNGYFDGTEGVMKTNASGGKVLNNFYRIYTNEGSVDKNFGTIDKNSGSVEYNYGTITSNTGNVKKQYDKLSVVAPEGVTLSITGTEDPLANGTKYVLRGGSVTIKASGSHALGGVSADAANTCTKNADGSLTISGINASQTEKKAQTVTLTVELHSFTNYVSDENATCSEDGTKTATCDYCSATKTVTDVDSALGHVIIPDPGYAPTCTEKGLTDGSHCERCARVLEEQSDINPLGHAFEEYVYNNDAKCLEDGTETAKCVRFDACGVTDTRTKENSKTGHTEAEDPKKEPTCTEPGLEKGSHCEVCEAVIVEQKPIDPLGHIDEDKNYVCDRCKTILITNTVSYKIIGGANSTWIMGSDKEVTVISSAEFDKFVRVEFDGKLLEKENYTAKSGSTAITFKNAFLKKLGEGKHSITVVSSDGKASTEMTVKKAVAKDPKKDTKKEKKSKYSSPNTADPSMHMTWILMLLVSAVAIAGAFSKRRSL